MTNLPQSRQSNIVVQELENEILIYDLKTNKAYSLNETSAMIWQLCDGQKTVTEISQSLAGKLKQPITEDVIWLALDQFKRDNLLENNDQFEIDFNGLSRRQVMKKIGLASMMMIPLISSVIAPTAATAASGGFALTAACTSNSQCRSNNCIACSGSSCAGSSTCCAPGNAGNAPGTVVNSCNFEFTCSNPVFGQVQKCCSGRTIWTFTDCAAPANPGAGVCSCAP